MEKGNNGYVFCKFCNNYVPSEFIEICSSCEQAVCLSCIEDAGEFLLCPECANEYRDIIEYLKMKQKEEEGYGVDWA